MGLLDEAIREHLELKRRRGADAGDVSRAESEALGPVRRTPDGAPDLASIPIPPPEPLEDVPMPEAEPVARDEPAARVEDEPLWEGEPAIGVPSAPELAEPSAPTASHEPPPAYEAPPSGYVMPPPTLPPPADHGHEPDPALDEHPPGFGDFEDEMFEEPPPPPRKAKRLLGGLRLRRRGGGDEDDEPEAPAPRGGRDEAGDYDPPTADHSPPAPATQAYEPPPAHDRDVVPADDEPEDLLEETPEFLEETPDHDRLWFEQRPPRDFDFDK